MKVLVRETEKTVVFRIYGINGRECTREFFRTFFNEADGVHESTTEEKVMYGKDIVYSIETQEFCDLFKSQIDRIQYAIDELSLAIINGYTEEEFRFESDYYAL